MNTFCVVQTSLVWLLLNGMGLTGTIPSCLYSQGSFIFRLDLGEPLHARHRKMQRKLT